MNSAVEATSPGRSMGTHQPWSILTPRPHIVIGVTLLVTAGNCVLRFLTGWPGSTLTQTWQATQWWISYRTGLVRRGFPGQVLAWLVGGSPSSVAVDVAAAVLIAATVAAFVWLAWDLSRSLAGVNAWVVRALILASPFTLSTSVKDVGRYDEIGIIAVAVILGVRHRRPAVLVPAVAVAAIVAVASEELLLAFVGPLAALVAWRATRSVPAVTGTLAPPVAVAAASLLLTPSREQLYAMTDAAHAARPAITRETTESAIRALNQTTDQALGNLAMLAWWVVPVATVLFLTLNAVTLHFAWIRLARPFGKQFGLMSTWYAAAAVALSIVGIDYRRWWALAFVASAATLAVLPTIRDRVDRQPVRPVLVTFILALSVAGQFAPMTSRTIDPAGSAHQVFGSMATPTPQ